MMRSVLLCLLFFLIFLTIPAEASIGVSVQNFSFTPNSITIAASDTVIWTRVSGTHNVHHNVAEPKFHNEISSTWSTYVWPCTVATGAYPYVCQNHPVMTGTLTVASLTVTAPNGGENWVTGGSRAVNWSTVNLAGSVNVRIELNRSYPAGAWETVIASTPNDGLHSFTLTGATTTHARIRVRTVATSSLSGSIADTSDADFTISSPSVTVVYPNGGEVWVEDEVRTIQWASIGFTTDVTIQLNRDFPGASWQTIVSGTPNDGSYDWTVTFPSTTNARIRVYRSSQTSISDTSDANFTIIAPDIDVLTPNGGEVYHIGDTIPITWTSQAIVGNFHVDLNRAYPGGEWERIFTNVAQEDPHEWVAEGTTSENCRIRVLTVSVPATTDLSDADFAISIPQLAVTDPNGGESFMVGDSVVVTWTAVAVGDSFDVFLNRDYIADPSGPLESLWLAAHIDSPHVWIATAPASPNCRIIVRAISDTTVSDACDSEFSIGEGSIQVLAPNGMEAYFIGVNRELSWSSVGAIPDVRILLDRNYPSVAYDTVFASTPNDGSEFFTVTGPATSTARIRIESVTQPEVGDESDADFSIADVPFPDSLVIAVAGEFVALHWNLVDNVDSFAVYKSTDVTSPEFPEFVGTTSDATLVDSAATIGGTKYFYYVKSIVD